MKILWFAGNPGLYANNNKYNGGGWIGALQREILKQDDVSIEIEIAFPWSDNIEEVKNGIKYYGIQKAKRSFWNFEKKQNIEYSRCKEIIEFSKPDVIHVFGSEFEFGMVCTMTNIPVIIHLQGILISCINFWLPQGVSWFDYIMYSPKNYLTRIGLKHFIERERKIFSHCKYFMGRTDWDKSTIALLANNHKYFYCSEMLRPEIYYSTKVWKKKNNEKRKIVSIISGAPYKGGDVILKAAKELMLCIGDSFEWYVYGVDDMKFFSKVTKITPKDVNVHVGGIINAIQLVDIVTDCDIFVHPSYIENSPNTVCEAQLLGAPVVATNVGGVSSLINDGKDGMLVPSGDACMMASRIKLLFENNNLCLKLNDAGRKTALNRHSPSKIVKDLIYIYNTIVAESN